MFLAKYCVKLNNYPNKNYFQPFKSWDTANPTQSFPWRDGYNKTKHNKTDYFSEASLEKCINAIATNIIMFCVRYSPYALIEEHDLCSNLVNKYFSVELFDLDISSFHIPAIKSTLVIQDFSWLKESSREREWGIKSFVL